MKKIVLIMILILGVAGPSFAALYDMRTPVNTLTTSDVNKVMFLSYIGSTGYTQYVLTEDTKKKVAADAANLLNSNSGNFALDTPLYCTSYDWITAPSSGNQVYFNIAKEESSSIGSQNGTIPNPWSTTLTLTAINLSTTGYLPKPAAFSGFAGKASAIMTWESSGSGVTYHVYRRYYTSSVDWGPKTSGQYAIYQHMATTTNTYYNETSLTNGTKYFYMVYAETGGNASFSPHTDEIMVTPNASAAQQVVKVVPSSAGRSTTANISIYGVGFAGFNSSTDIVSIEPVSTGTPVTLSNITVVSDNLITATIPALAAQAVTYNVTVTMSGISSAKTNNNLFTVTDSTPAAPSNLNGSVSSLALTDYTSVVFNWTDNSNDETGYKISSNNPTVVNILSPNTTTYTKIDVTGPNTPVTATVVATNGAGDSSVAGPVTVYTRAMAPTIVSAIPQSSSSIQITWGANAGGNYKFSIDRAADSSGAPGAVTVGYMTNISGSSISTVDANLSSSTRYWYRVVGYNNNMVPTAATSWISGETLAGAPGRPTLSANPVSGRDIQCTWNAVTGATGYRLYRDGTEFYSGAGTSWLLTGLVSNHAYACKVDAYNVSGVSTSDPVTVNTYASIPTNLTGEGTSSSTIKLYWNSLDATRFYIDRAPDNAGNPGTWDTDYKKWDDNITTGTFTDTTLTAATKYWYRVGGYNADQIKTGTTVPISVETLSMVPAATNLTAEATSTQLTWRWVNNATDATGVALYKNGTQYGGIMPPTTATTIEAGMLPCQSVEAYIKSIRGVDSTPSESTREWTLPVAPDAPSYAARTTYSYTMNLVKGFNVKPVFDIERAPEGGTGTYDAWMAVGTGEAGPTFTDNNSIVTGTRYSWRTYAVNGNGRKSAASSIWTDWSGTTGSEPYPPSIEAVTLNGKKFRPGDIIPPSFTLRATIYDLPLPPSVPSKIVPNGTVEVILDLGKSTTITIVPDYNETERIMSAQISLPSEMQKTESHTVTIHARDNNYNESWWTANGVLMRGAVQVVGNVYNYPNPFKPLSGDPGMNVTRIQYRLSADANVTIILYDLSGNEVKRFNFGSGENGGTFGLNTVIWNGRSLFGDVVGNGMYLYKIVSGNKVIGGGKLVVLD